ncbi:MAG: DNA/RNA nuclease SfsA [Alphaproteobacteria bacterium]|nr:DNA/RNA nuclease SfsA [Alphaproteobacteria bacterium]
MKFEHHLVPGTLIRRYKRFLADIQLNNGETITAHCANPGSMTGLQDEGSPVWLAPVTNPKAKLKYKWELVAVGDTLVGLNTARANRIVEEAITAAMISEVTGYGTLRREVKYGQNSRIDFLLSQSSAGKADCYVEVKSVTLCRQPGRAEFPDSVTVRGTKHLRELADMVARGYRAIMIYLVQRDDCLEFSLAADIDPGYAVAFDDARQAGVEAVCYRCNISPEGITASHEIPILRPATF